MDFVVSSILQELHSHPHDRAGFQRADFDGLNAGQRQALAGPILDEVATGDRYADAAAQWLFGDDYCAALAARLAQLPPQLPQSAPGRFYLRQRLYEASGDRGYLDTLVLDLARGLLPAEFRRNAMFSLVRQSGAEALVRDLCRHLVLHDPDPAVREAALLQLARETGYPEPWYPPNRELSRCLQGARGPHGPSRHTLATLDRLHPDTGALAALLARTG